MLSCVVYTNHQLVQSIETMYSYYVVSQAHRGEYETYSRAFKAPVCLALEHRRLGWVEIVHKMHLWVPWVYGAILRFIINSVKMLWSCMNSVVQLGYQSTNFVYKDVAMCLSLLYPWYGIMSQAIPTVHKLNMLPMRMAGLSGALEWWLLINAHATLLFRTQNVVSLDCVTPGSRRTWNSQLTFKTPLCLAFEEGGYRLYYLGHIYGFSWVYEALGLTFSIDSVDSTDYPHAGFLQTLSIEIPPNIWSFETKIKTLHEIGDLL